LYRPRRSQHQCLDVLGRTIQQEKVNHVVEADVKSFFDEVNHEWMVKFLRHRIGDERVIRLIIRMLKSGIMEDGLYDFESVYGLNMSITKRQRLLYRDSTVNHGMAFIGVDLLDGTPQKWLVENSWGSDKGQDGLWTMYDNWFDQYVFNLVVHKKYLPKAVLDILAKPATPLPAWDPMW
ncbi:MAG: hypothetical protein GY809_22615, partial [Planctomycetes bacterium]|nr:hypothetical protein [Planctomycetota bacterium]